MVDASSVKFTPAIGFLTPNGDLVNIQYLNQHMRPSPVGTWWKEATLILNHYLVHAEIARPAKWVGGFTDLQPLQITGFYYGLDLKEHFLV
jgi:hypothetical protein